MSNRFKFRAWLPSWQEMNYSHAPDDVDWFFNGEHFILSVFYDDGFAGQMQELEGVVIMQSTGLKDKNGVEIYEGDLISMYGEKDPRDYFEVEWNDDMLALVMYRDNSIESFADHNTSDLEIAGNIYDNPELLENKQ